MSKEIKRKNRIKLIIKLMIVLPLFYFIGRYLASDLFEGSMLKWVIFFALCNVAGPILAKI